MTRIPRAPYPELASLLDQFVAGVRSALADNFAGAYLVGSIATGDFDLDSDVDFLIVTNDELSDLEVRSLQKVHAEIHVPGCYLAEHLEGSYINRKLLNQPESAGVQPLWYVDNGSTSLERSFHDNQLHVRWILRERGITLAGPDPKTLMQPIPADALRAEMAAAMKKLASRFVAEIDQPLAFFNTRFGQSFTVLTGCRILHTLQTGEIHSKLSGLLWSKQALDPAWHELIQQAWSEREGARFCVKIRQPAEPEVLRKTADFMKYARNEYGAI